MLDDYLINISFPKFSGNSRRHKNFLRFSEINMLESCALQKDFLHSQLYENYGPKGTINSLDR